MRFELDFEALYVYIYFLQKEIPNLKKYISVTNAVVSHESVPIKFEVARSLHSLVHRVPRLLF